MFSMTWNDWQGLHNIVCVQPETVQVVYSMLLIARVTSLHIYDTVTGTELDAEKGLIPKKV